MDSLLGRFRNLTVLLLVLFAQLILLAFQVKTSQDVPLIRAWTVTAITPLARALEGGRTGAVRLVEDYFLLSGVRQKNRFLEAELGRLKRENQFLRSELGAADRTRALMVLQARMPSRTIAARIIGIGAGASSQVVFVDRGSAGGVMKGMAVVTADGIVGRIIAAYPTAAQVLLVTDPSFAAGVISGKHRVQGTLKGTGRAAVCIVDYLQNEQKVDVGEWFYTTGDDRVFPRGLPAGTVKYVGAGSTFKDVQLTPTGLAGGLEEVLIIVEGVHQQIPEGQESPSGPYLLPGPPSDHPSEPAPAEAGRPALGTEADRLREHYRRIGDAQGHVFGEAVGGAKPPDFNLKIEERPPAPGAPPPAGGSALPATKQPPPGAPPSPPPGHP